MSNLKELSIGEFLDLFDESVHSQIMASAAHYTDRVAIACFETLDLGLIARFGPQRCALVIGPSNTIKSIEQLSEPGCRIGDVPSRFKYPVSYVRQG